MCFFGETHSRFLDPKTDFAFLDYNPKMETQTPNRFLSFGHIYTQIILGAPEGLLGYPKIFEDEQGSKKAIWASGFLVELFFKYKKAIFLIHVFVTLFQFC